MEFTQTLIYGRPNTTKTYRSLFLNHIKPLNPPPWTEEDLIHTVGYWDKYKKLAPRTIKSLVGLSARYNKFCGGKDLDTRRILRAITTDQKVPVKALNQQQARSLLQTIEKYHSKLYLVSSIAYHTGARVGEIFGLDWSDINFNGNRILIQRSYDGPTKNGKSRLIPLSTELKKVLSTQERINNRIVDRRFDPNPMLNFMCTAANVPKITMHGFRHTFATLALEAGRSPKQVQEVLGHSNLSTTLDIYWSSINGDLELGFC